jgi:quinol monooxygenase YgiN
MRQLIGGLLVALLAPVFVVGQTPAQPSKNVYVITLIDVIRPPAGLGEINNLLLRFAADSRKDPGVVRFDVVVQDGRPNHFVLLEVWRSREAFEAHSAAAHTRAFREKLQPSLGSPFDERLNVPLQ